jgi:hypothetical protein
MRKVQSVLKPVNFSARAKHERLIGHLGLPANANIDAVCHIQALSTYRVAGIHLSWTACLPGKQNVCAAISLLKSTWMFDLFREESNVITLDRRSCALNNYITAIQGYSGLA